MGLDGVELVMAVEEEFGCDIDDAAAEKMRTPRDMIDYVCATLRAAHDGCASQQAFYRVRRVLMELTGRPRREISPATPIEELFPGRRVYDRDWSRVRDAASPGLTVSRLALPGCLLWPCGTLPVAVLFLGLWLGMPFSSVGEVSRFVVVSSIGAPGCWLILYLAGLQVVGRNVARGRIADGIITLRDLAPPFLQSASGRNWTRDNVAARVKQLVKDQLGISEEKYREDADFIRDLGIG